MDIQCPILFCECLGDAHSVTCFILIAIIPEHRASQRWLVRLSVCSYLISGITIRIKLLFCHYELKWLADVHCWLRKLLGKLLGNYKICICLAFFFRICICICICLSYFFPCAYAYAYASLIFSPYAYAYAYAPLIFFPYAYAYHMQAYACDMHMHVICAYAFDNTASEGSSFYNWNLFLKLRIRSSAEYHQCNILFDWWRAYSWDQIPMNIFVGLVCIHSWDQ